MSVDEWFNAVQNQVNLAKYPPETARSCKETFFVLFFLNDEDIMSKTINDSNIDLEKFPGSKVRQLAKKLESSKSTTRHIKKMSSYPQATQRHQLRHQRTELPPSKAQRKQFKKNKPRPKIWSIQMMNITKHITSKMNLTRRNSIQDRLFKVKTDVTNMETQNT